MRLSIAQFQIISIFLSTLEQTWSSIDVDILSPDDSYLLHDGGSFIDLGHNALISQEEKAHNKSSTYERVGYSKSEIFSQIEVAIREADQMKSREDFTGAAAFLFDVLHTFRDQLNNLDISDMLFSIGIAFLEGKMFEEAITVLVDSVRVLESDDTFRVAESMDFIGESYLGLGQNDVSIEIWSKSAELWQSIDEYHRFGDTLNSLGVAYFRLGDYATATKLCELAILNYKSKIPIDTIEQEMSADRLIVAQSNLKIITKMNMIKEEL